MDFRFAQIDHVDISTPEELQEEMVAWYRDQLGLEELPTDRAGGGRYAIGEQEIHISVDPHNPPKVAHFCLLVENYDAVVARLRQGGSHIEQARAIPGRRRFYTRDPAGNRIEIATLTEQEA